MVKRTCSPYSAKHDHQWSDQLVPQSLGKHLHKWFGKNVRTCLDQHIHQWPASMLASDLANIFTSDSTNIFTCALVKAFKSDSANIFTSDLANMFTSDLAKMFTIGLANRNKLLHSCLTKSLNRPSSMVIAWNVEISKNLQGWFSTDQKVAVIGFQTK